MATENHPAQDGPAHSWINVRMHSELKEAARVQAAENGVSMAEYIRMLIREDTN